MTTTNGKTIIITGASRGIGEATARLFAKQGNNVVLAARSLGDITRISSELASAGHKALPIACDVSDYNQVKRLVAQTVEQFGAPDILVNNAGTIDPISRIDMSNPEAWGRVVDINLKGVYHGVRSILPPMLKQGSGTIINVSSGAATSALEGWSHYCSTKAAVLSLTKCIHREYGDHGIRVMGLSPGTVATDMQRQIKASGINPVSRLDFESHIPTSWVAKAIEYLCSTPSDDYLGQDFSIKTDAGREAVGLPLAS